MPDKKDDHQGRLTWGIILIGIGFIFLLSNWNIIPDFDESWPIILIVVGVALLFASKRRDEERKKSGGQETGQISPPPEKKE